MVAPPNLPELNRTARDRGRSAALTIAVMLLSLVAVASAMRLLSGHEPLSHRVVVGAQGCGGECDRMLAGSLASNLRQIGFDAVAPQHVAELGGPEATRAFAREHAARFAVVMVVAVEERTELRGSALTRVNANASIYVMDANDRTAPSPAFMLRSVDEGSDEQTALRALGRRLLSALLPGTASVLLASEPVAALQGEAASMEQRAAALTMKKHSKHLAARSQAMREYEQHCQRNDATLAEHRDGVCLSGGCAEEYVVGVLPNGEAAVVHDSTNDAVFPLEPTPMARSFPTAERLWLVPLQGDRQAPRTLLAEATNFYSQPSLSRDGRMLAYVERHQGRSRLYAGALLQRERTRILEVVSPARLTQPRLAPDGSALAFFALERRGGRAALMVTPLEAGGEPRQLLPHALDAQWIELGQPDEPDKKRLWLTVLVPGVTPNARAGASDAVEELDPADHPLPELRLMDPESGAVADRVRAAHHIRALGEVHDGALLLGFADDAEDPNLAPACGFARYRPSEPIEWVSTPLCPKHLAAGAAGAFAHAGFAGPGGQARPTRQLVRLEGESVTPLTHSRHDLQRPRPAADASTLVYEYVLPRTYGEFQHVAVCHRQAPDGREREE